MKFVIVIAALTVVGRSLSAGDYKGTVVSVKHTGVGDQAVFMFGVSPDPNQPKPSCGLNGYFSFPLNIRNAVFLASLLTNALSPKNWQGRPSVSVSLKDQCSYTASARDAYSVAVYDGQQEVAFFEPGFPIRYYNPVVPVDSSHPLPPIVSSLAPSKSPSLKPIVEQFLIDRCAMPGTEFIKKWATDRSQLNSVLSLMVKVPIAKEVADKMNPWMCKVIEAQGKRVLDEGWRQSYTERIVGNSATVMWRGVKPDIYHGFTLYRENGVWKFDARFNEF